MITWACKENFRDNLQKAMEITQCFFFFRDGGDEMEQSAIEILGPIALWTCFYTMYCLSAAKIKKEGKVKQAFNPHPTDLHRKVIK